LPHRRALAPVWMVLVIAATACGTAGHRLRPAAPAASPSPTPSSCNQGSTVQSPDPAAGPNKPGGVTAVLVDVHGRVCWQTSLPLENVYYQPEPVLSASLAYFAVGSEIRAVRLTDGRAMWDWTGPTLLRGADQFGIDGMWLIGGVLAVSDGTVLTGLDATTGAVHWTAGAPHGYASVGPGGGLDPFPAPVADGGIVVSGDDDEGPPPPGPSCSPFWPCPAGSRAVKGWVGVLDAATGHLRWRVDNADVITAAPDVVIAASPAATDLVTSIGDVMRRVPPAGQVHIEAIDAATGRVRWSEGATRFGPVYMGDGLVVYNSGIEPGDAVPTAFDLATGAMKWRSPDLQAVALGVEPAGVLFLGSSEIGLLDPLDGRPVWEVPTQEERPDFTEEDVFVPVGPRGLLTDISVSTGHIKWQHTGPAAACTSTSADASVLVDPYYFPWTATSPLPVLDSGTGCRAWSLNLSSGQIGVVSSVDLPGRLLMVAAVADFDSNEAH
jgi:outer membrane protein assembly factor BamB